MSSLSWSPGYAYSITTHRLPWGLGLGFDVEACRNKKNEESNGKERQNYVEAGIMYWFLVRVVENLEAWRIPGSIPQCSYPKPETLNLLCGTRSIF